MGRGERQQSCIAVERGREGVSSSVCWWGYVHWFRDRREGSVSVEGAGSPLLHLRMQGTCCSSYMLVPIYSTGRGGWCREGLVVLGGVWAHTTPHVRKSSLTLVLPDSALNHSQDQAFHISPFLLHPTCSSCSAFSFQCWSYLNRVV